MWPIPCFPPIVTGRCRLAGTWCYANRTATGYALSPAPGIWNRPAHVPPGWAWPVAAESFVRPFYEEWDWPTLRLNEDAGLGLRAVRALHASVLGARDRFIVVLRTPGSGATLSFRPEQPLAGRLIDANTGRTIQDVRLDARPGEVTDLAIPQASDLMLLGLRASRP
jgi:hypothetical protein